MLKELRLNNIVLVETATIPFAPHFNVISGESGSGKSAIMNALSLIAGERSDTSAIRRGAEKGSVEASFDIESLPELYQLLHASGIDHEPGNELFIRRELASNGKSRAFINNQLAQLCLLKQVSDLLFDIVGQHANQKLMSLEYHRKAIDLFGSLQQEAKAFADCWEEEMQTRQTLDQLISTEAQRLRDIEICRMEIEELEQANLKEGEEETLFAEYTALSNADELAQKVGDLTRMLNGEKIAVLSLLSRQKVTFEQLSQLAPTLSETATSYNNVLIELEDIAHTLRNFESRIEHNPSRADELNKRLELISRLKRKYGNTIEEINSYLKQAQERLYALENADTEIESLKESVQRLSEKSNALSNALTKKRKNAAQHFQKEITAHLQSLNMPKAEFDVEISSQKRSKWGDDKVEFFLTPNIGEHRVSLRDCASGGELSRIMLSLQAVLAGKEHTPTIIFDEVDANIGGETATVVGDKLCEIGKKHQILCITHFPQVAKKANHHLCISKKEIEGRTQTLVELLNAATRKKELTRMLGG